MYFENLGRNLYNFAKEKGKVTPTMYRKAHKATIDTMVAVGPAVVLSASQPGISRQITQPVVVPVVRASNLRRSAKSAAAEIYTKMVGSARKDVISAFMDETGLTINGAKTYYQNFRSVWSDAVGGLKW